MSKFAERLRELRLKRGENQSDIAKLLGVSVQSYSAYEGAREPKYSFLCKLAEHYNTTVDYRIGASDIFIKPESMSDSPQLNAALAMIQQELFPLFEDMGKDSSGYSRIFNEYICEGVSQRVERCRMCYAKRDLFANENEEIDLVLMKMFLRGIYSPDK